jgi:hypothetical protein
VEVLVADQAQQGVVALAGLGLSLARQIAAAADQRRAVAVLEAAIVVIHHIEHEDIAIHGRLAAVGMPEGDLGLADLLRIGEQALAIKAGRGTGDHKLVGHAAGRKAAAPEAAHLHGAVHQLVVMGCRVEAEAVGVDLRGRQAGGHLPVLVAGLPSSSSAWGYLPAMHAQAQAGAVEEATPAIQPGGAHRGVISANLIADNAC